MWVFGKYYKTKQSLKHEKYAMLTSGVTRTFNARGKIIQQALSFTNLKEEDMRNSLQKITTYEISSFKVTNN